jgi:hypothetical protein
MARCAMPPNLTNSERSKVYPGADQCIEENDVNGSLSRHRMEVSGDFFHIPTGCSTVSRRWVKLVRLHRMPW